MLPLQMNPLRNQVTSMLSSMPIGFATSVISEELIASFQAYGPLTIEHFTAVAEAYKLPQPEFKDREVVFGRRKGDQIIGMIDSAGQKRGILREYTNGDLEEYFENSGKCNYKLGLYRKISKRGAVTLSIYLHSRGPLETIAFNKLGTALIGANRDNKVLR
jgi:hypothetical protein